MFCVLLCLEFASKAIPHLKTNFSSSLAIAPGPPPMSTRSVFCGGLECDHQLEINIHVKCVCKCCYKSVLCQNLKKKNYRQKILSYYSTLKNWNGLKHLRYMALVWRTFFITLGIESLRIIEVSQPTISFSLQNNFGQWKSS